MWAVICMPLFVSCNIFKHSGKLCACSAAAQYLMSIPNSKWDEDEYTVGCCVLSDCVSDVCAALILQQSQMYSVYVYACTLICMCL